MIRKLYKKYEELILYLIVGGCTMAVSLASYYLLRNVFHMYYQTANILSWVFAVVFAYITNKRFVFRSPYAGIRKTFLEAGSFFSARLVSLAAEVLSMYILVRICGINDNIVKLINQVLVMVLNYILSKFWVFHKKHTKNIDLRKE